MVHNYKFQHGTVLCSSRKQGVTDTLGVYQCISAVLAKVMYIVSVFASGSIGFIGGVIFMDNTDTYFDIISRSVLLYSLSLCPQTMGSWTGICHV